ncbi:polyphosphoinositide phosphatase-like isoform X2 [Saccostrea echinata]|uniref:polyphosphoinositide phosphatase-like isoform X2 n=1 Tax=Saccostrea echinata TaxID=191078 RepID=UPI002A7F5F0A|nr:polyphosphoinositide phosphatase-like isoform X2 [Saccostrea echinata]
MEYPIISCIQKVILYETKARFYIVGSNSTESRFRVLKIDRTEPKELVIHDDKVEYNKLEVRNLLTMIKSGNTTIESKKTDSALIKTVSAFGIAGFVRFLEGYYIILITKRRKVALIGPHVVYKIEDTTMMYIPNDTVRKAHHEESKYVKMFQSVDMSDNFYFSYSYDLTHRLQYNMTSTLPPDLLQHGPSPPPTVFGVRSKPAEKYVWNSYLLKKCREVVHPDWLLFLIHGFVDQKNINVFGKSVYLTLIARRSNKFAGTRFLKRGANNEGYVANEVESEQIVIDSSVTFLEKTGVTSFVQMRGSIPLYWSQDVTKMVPKPPITLDQSDPYAGAAGHHFNQTLSRYGSPIIILNLVKRRERRKHESILTGEYKSTINYLNQFLPPEHKIRYIGFDMAHISKSKTTNVLVRLSQIARKCVRMTGFFVHMPKPVSEDFWKTEEFRGLQGQKTTWGCRQTGVVRTNCVDCLDRTNTAQFAIGRCALGYQLFTLGVISSPDLEFDTDCLKMLEHLYEAHGDTIALQYGGSQLVHRIEGYRKIAPWTSHSKDIMHTLSRYYSNTFSDLEKQTATNIFLGLYAPEEGKPNIWELPTDFYLHNKDVRAVLDYLCYSFTQWWEVPVYRSLPLPYEEEKKPNDCTIVAMAPGEECLDHYYDYYRTSEFTSIHELFPYTMSHSVRDYKPKAAKHDSPFILRVPSETKDISRSDSVMYHRVNSRTMLFMTESQELNPNISGKDSTSSQLSTGSSESDSESSDVDGTSVTETSVDSESEIKFKGFQSIKISGRSFPSKSQDYGQDLHKYTPNHKDTWMYERYVKISEVCQTPPKKEEKGVTTGSIIENLVFPKSVFKLGSSYGVEPPPVNKQDQDIYNHFVLVGTHGAGEPNKKEIQFYNKYLNKFH